MSDFLAQYGGFIGLVIGLMVLFGAPLLKGAKAVGSFVAARLPKRSPVTFGSLLSAKFEIEYWKLILLAVAIWLVAGGGGLKLPSLPGWPSFVTRADAVTYVHEQRAGSMTPAIAAALSALNDKGVVATPFDQDTLNEGGGVVPAQYVVPLAAAKKVGLPAVVSTAGDRVLKTIKDPKAEDILALAP